MKPFNLERALAGDPVCMRDGTPVKVVFVSNLGDKYPVLYIWEEDNQYMDDWCSIEGKGSLLYDLDNDLFMATKKKKVYIQISKRPDNYRQVYATSCAHVHKDELGNETINFQVVEVEIEVDE